VVLPHNGKTEDRIKLEETFKEEGKKWNISKIFS
jgi:hypothetical protein